MPRKSSIVIGSKYNKLTVLSLHHKTSTGVKYFTVRCDCGKEKIIRGSHISSGATTSCGCDLSKSKIKDLTGQTINDLTILKLLKVENHRAVYECKCSCGNILQLNSKQIKGRKGCTCNKSIEPTVKVIEVKPVIDVMTRLKSHLEKAK